MAEIDPDRVIERVAQHLGQQIGVLSAQLVVRDEALEAARARIAELEAQADTGTDTA
jgi:hypothetical protein